MKISIGKLDFLPEVSGVYRVLDANNNVIYVGQARNIRERWKNHHKLKEIVALCGVDAYIDWVEIPEWLLNRVENTAVCFYQPKLNRKNPPVV
jgi:excinuclease UvrABC nuclease subunit